MIKCVIPAAGYGSRFGSITQTFPKALIPVAGKQAIFHIIDSVIKADISHFVIIIGYLGERIKKAILNEYKKQKFEFVEQKEQLGLGHAVYQARPYFKSSDSMLLIYGDTLFKTSVDLKLCIHNQKQGWLGLYKVENPKNYGVVELDDEQKKIIHLYEKPENPVSNLAISGVNYFINALELFSAIEHIIKNGIKTKNEYQITDAYDYMIQSANISLAPIYLESWYDVGTLPMLLNTNKIFLKNKNYTKFSPYTRDSKIQPHVHISENSSIQDSNIKNYTCIGKNSIIKNSTIENSIILDGVTIENSYIYDSFISSDAKVQKFAGKCTLGNKATIENF